jgi:hypothetical protein
MQHQVIKWSALEAANDISLFLDGEGGKLTKWDRRTALTWGGKSGGRSAACDEAPIKASLSLFAVEAQTCMQHRVVRRAR